MDFSTLPVVSTLSDCITIKQKDDIKIACIDHPKASAAVSLFGAHVLSYKPQGKEDVIWVSKKAIFDGQTAIRGGIPLCWPWFGKLASPSHGFSRIQEWKIVEHRENEQGVIVQLGLSTNEMTLTMWPNQFEATLTIEISDTLKVSLDVSNTDSKAWKFSGALHSYLNVGDILSAEVTQMGPTYIDSLLGDKVYEGGDTLKIEQEVDRVYNQPEKTVLLKDEKLNRTISITNSGNNSAVIWNPWQANSESMGDMADDSYKTMLCIESTLHADSLETGHSVEPGENYVLTTTISTS